jgi:hypothetical protein
MSENWHGPRLTNEEFARALADTTQLSFADVNRILPRRSDKDRFLLLARITTSRKSSKDKAAELRKHIDELGPIVMKLLRATVF